MSDLKSEVIAAMREYILSEHAYRMRPEGWQSVPRSLSQEYLAIKERARAARSKLWEITDFEYAQDGFRNFAWEWRYWKVMARKCCWSQSGGSTKWASETMSKLAKAEDNFVDACGLTDLYRAPSEYIERMFPKLRIEP